MLFRTPRPGRPAAPAAPGSLAVLAALAPLALGAAALAGCEEAVDPFVNTDRYYTVYGYLDTDRDTQYVRVIPLRKTIDADEGPVRAVVTTTDETTGATVAWRDSLVAFFDGTTGHVFRAVFRPEHGHVYRLRVRRDDGVETTAATAVPLRREPVVAAPTFDPFLPRSIEQDVTWPRLDTEPLRTQVWFRLADPRRPGFFRDLVLDGLYDDAASGTNTAGGRRFRLRLARDADSLRKRYGITDAPALYAVGMKVTVPDAQWRAPGGVFDPDILIEPSVFTNVEGGFGFFGSVSQMGGEWALSRSVTEAIGFSWPNR